MEEEWSGCQEKSTDLFEESFCLEAILEDGDGRQEQHQASTDNTTPYQQQQQQQQQLVNYWDCRYDDNSSTVVTVQQQQQIRQLQSESDALLNSFAAELLSDTDFQPPTAVDSASIALDDGSNAYVYYPQQQQWDSEGGSIEWSLSSPSPTLSSSGSAASGGSDVTLPPLTEDFDEMALIPETLVAGAVVTTTATVTQRDSAGGGGGDGISAHSSPEEDDESRSTPVCPVCGNSAGKHSYYGGQVCNSCRAFFRRSVQNKTHPRFQCKKEGSCSINSRSWKSCQACRFQKCLQAGMKAGWVLTESERKARAKQRSDTRRKRLEQQQRTASTSATAVVSSSSSLSTQLSSLAVRVPEDIFTEDDRAHIWRLIDSTYDFLNIEMCKFYTRNLAAYDEILASLYRGTQVSQYTQRMTENFMIYSVQNFYRGMGDMMNLSGRDQNLLVSKNYPLILEFVYSIFIEAAPDTEKFLNKFVQKLQELPIQQAWAERTREVRMLEDKFNQVSLSNSLKVKPVTYEQLHPDDWIRDKGAQRRYRELCFKVRDWPRDYDDSGGGNNSSGKRDDGTVDEVQSMLMGLIMLFSTDFLELDDPRRASSVQTKYGTMLYRYLKTKYRVVGGDGGAGAALAKFCQGMFVSSMSREMREIKERHWKNS